MEPPGSRALPVTERCSSWRRNWAAGCRFRGQGGLIRLGAGPSFHRTQKRAPCPSRVLCERAGLLGGWSRLSRSFYSRGCPVQACLGGGSRWAETHPMGKDPYNSLLNRLDPSLHQETTTSRSRVSAESPEPQFRGALYHWLCASTWDNLNTTYII